MRTPSPIVSVLTTSYNREPYIGETIESVLAQTFTEFEYIIVDDCSTDRSFEIAQSYAAKDDRVRVYRNDPNLGDYPNRNKAASYSMGKYLKYVDADDRMYPTGLEVLVRMMDRFPDAGYGLCSLAQRAEQPYPILLSPREAYHSHFFGIPLFHKAPLSAILRRSAYEQVGGFPNRRMTSDYEMWLKLSQRYPVVLMPDGVVWYREHDGQEMTSHRKFLGQYESITFEYLQSPDCPLDRKDAERAQRNRRCEVATSTVRYALAGHLDSARDVSRAAGCTLMDYATFFAKVPAKSIKKFWK